jgi:hypothetical protein
MVYEHFLGCFILEDPSLGFSKLFQAVITRGDIPRLVPLVLEVGRLLAMAKGQWWSSSYCSRQNVSWTY